MMLPAGNDGSERLFARGYVPGPKITALPVIFGRIALLLVTAALNGADQHAEENRTRESTLTRLDRRYIFERKESERLRDRASGLSGMNVDDAVDSHNLRGNKAGAWHDYV